MEEEKLRLESEAKFFKSLSHSKILKDRQVKDLKTVQNKF
jgi:hypothetical protein